MPKKYNLISVHMMQGRAVFVRDKRHCRQKNYAPTPASLQQLTSVIRGGVHRTGLDVLPYPDGWTAVLQYPTTKQAACDKRGENRALEQENPGGIKPD